VTEEQEKKVRLALELLEIVNTDMINTARTVLRGGGIALPLLDDLETAYDAARAHARGDYQPFVDKKKKIHAEVRAALEAMLVR